MRQDKAKTIGIIATILLVGTTLFTFWYAYHVTQLLVQKTMQEVNGALGSVPGLQ
jgi:hypothetical protein